MGKKQIGLKKVNENCWSVKVLVTCTKFRRVLLINFWKNVIEKNVSNQVLFEIKMDT